MDRLYEVEWTEVVLRKMRAKAVATSEDQAIEIVLSGSSVEEVVLVKEIENRDWRASEIDE